MIRLILFYILTLQLIGCQSILSRPFFRPELSLRLAEEIQVGKTQQDEILKLLGKPDRIINLRDTDIGGQDVIWAYFADDVTSVGRISLSFSVDSNLVTSISFDVRQGDPEKTLEVALSRFKGVHFIKSVPKHWFNPHMAPDEIYFEDSKSGLTIIYLQAPKEVTTISWGTTTPTSPSSRSTTSDLESSKENKIPYCIAEICANQQNP